MRVVAVPVNGMPTSHEHHGLRRCEHILVADGAVTVAGPFNAFMRHFHRDVHAKAACLHETLDSRMQMEKSKTNLAMEEVLPEPHSDSTDATIITVINTPVRIVFPKVANVTVVVRGTTCAVSAYFSCSLGGATDHAEHVFCLPPR
jgi:hypothetical protein